MTYYHAPHEPTDPITPAKDIIAQGDLIPVIKYEGTGARRKVVRTVRNGRVRIFGYDFIPAAIVQYDGRFDGCRYVFWIYPKITYAGYIWYMPIVFMGFSERYYIASKLSDADERVLSDNKQQKPWLWWDVVHKESTQNA